MVTAVPPAAAPLLGLTLVTVGAAPHVYVYPLLNFPVSVSGLVTPTFTAPPPPSRPPPPRARPAPRPPSSAPVGVPPLPPPAPPLLGLTLAPGGADADVSVSPLFTAPVCVPGWVPPTFPAPAACAAVVAV